MAEFRDRFEVDLSQVYVNLPAVSPKPDGQPGPTRERMDALSEVQRGVHDYGYGAAEFVGGPGRQKLLHEEYSVHYGQGGDHHYHIAADWSSDHERFEVSAGHHRAFEAKEIGMSHMPMTVNSDEPGRIEALREASSARYPFRDTPPNGERGGISHELLDQRAAPIGPERQRER